LHGGLPHILWQLLLSSRQLSVVFGCTPCPWCAPTRINPLGVRSGERGGNSTTPPPQSVNPSVGQMFVTECPDIAMVVGRCPVLLQIKPHIIPKLSTKTGHDSFL
jgi:hypothetical protein